MASLLAQVQELVKGSEVTIGTVVVGFVVWRLMAYNKQAAVRKAKQIEEDKKAAEEKKKAARKPEKLEYRETWTLEELAKYNGLTMGKPLIISIKGVLYDVSARAEMYGPGGPYGAFAGKDASYMLATMSTEDNQGNKAWTNLSETEQQSLDQWESFFEGKYKPVGKLAKMPE
mmetsp:Transcript_56316/g.138219  ORF Transcript_56316/g.138219 Transcript_56316/m.138219 type:complete len:173 (-) Transcript_56316:19-537(-)|eukprot:CAMPEP_0206247458 /NCGR_PEP_ID=MMETSP0047_2-20121206/19820_1 /ASSEMBLY_ACC=CAM_ASM_000192 /TAXON_ID=195065 /ORGANISM="Chroomonas mesostigmatica_cf, Strain CCMP1168" /LENGTH=172 /DNA_ID=CAMNT_0053672983 /DNA_START=139 /DNA_END=657 /DNA_ORIENTATION=-